MVIGAMPVRVRAVRNFVWVLRSKVVILLGVSLNMDSMSVVSWVIGPMNALSIVGFLPLIRKLS